MLLEMMVLYRKIIKIFVNLRGGADKSLARPLTRRTVWTDKFLNFFEWLAKVRAMGLKVY